MRIPSTQSGDTTVEYRCDITSSLIPPPQHARYSSSFPTIGQNSRREANRNGRNLKGSESKQININRNSMPQLQCQRGSSDQTKRVQQIFSHQLTKQIDQRSRCSFIAAISVRPCSQHPTFSIGTKILGAKMKLIGEKENSFLSQRRSPQQSQPHGIRPIVFPNRKSVAPGTAIHNARNDKITMPLRVHLARIHIPKEMNGQLLN